MQRFVELAGGTNCVPSFTYSLGQAGSCDGLVSRTLWDDHAKKKNRCQNSFQWHTFGFHLNWMRCCSCPGLIMHAGSLSNLKSFSFLMHSKRVADWMKKKVGQTKALCVAHSSISSSTLPADMSMHFQSRKTHISAYHNIIKNAILSSDTLILFVWMTTNHHTQKYAPTWIG